LHTDLTAESAESTESGEGGESAERCSTARRPARCKRGERI